MSRSLLTTPRRTGLALVAGALLLGAAGAPAWAAPGESTTVNVSVAGAISMTGLPSNVALSGAPGATVSNTAGYTVTTNNTAGYTVSVKASDSVLKPANTTTNPDTIPISALSVAGTTGGPVALSDTNSVTVHSQAARSDADGNDLSTTYSMTVPFVNADSYSVGIDYIATAS